MRQVLSPRIVVAVLCAGSLACGGFETLDALTVGGVRGTVPADVAVDADAVAFAMHEPSARAPISAHRMFEVRDVPARAEPVELYVRATNDRFGRVAVTINGGQLVEVGEVPLTPGGSVNVIVEDDDHNPLPAAVSLLGSHLAEPVNIHGSAWVGPVAEGCYTVRVTVPQLGTREQVGCTGLGVEFEFGDDVHVGEHP